MDGACAGMSAVVVKLEAQHSRSVEADSLRAGLEAQAMRSALRAPYASASAQTFLSGSEGLRIDGGIGSRSWRLAGSVESYAGLASEVRISLVRDLLDDTPGRSREIDSLEVLRIRMARLRREEAVMARLREILFQRAEFGRLTGEIEARRALLAWGEALRAGMGRMQDGGMLQGRFLRDLELVFHENDALAEIASRRADVIVRGVEGTYSLSRREFETLDPEGLAPALAAARMPPRVSDEIDSLRLEETHWIQRHHRTPSRRLYAGPALRFGSNHDPSWRSLGLTLSLSMDLGEAPTAPVLRPPLPRSRPAMEGAEPEPGKLQSLGSAIDSALSESVRIGAIDPASGYSRMAELLQRRLAASLAALDLRTARSHASIRLLERFHQLREGGCHAVP